MSIYVQMPLHQVITQDKNYIYSLEPRPYPKLSVKLYGRGVVLDTPTDGATIRMKRHQLAKPGQIILSEIWAKKGAIGLVPPEGAGALITSHFFLFDIDHSKILPEYMGWLLKGNYFAPNLDAEARGTTGYAAIRAKQFLQLTIPLPPPDEQRRIVARIEALAGRVAEAQRLRAEALAQMNQVVSSLHQKLSSNRTAKLGDLLVLDEDQAPVTSGGDYPQVGVRGFGNGLFAKESISDDQTSYKHFNRLYEGALVLSQVKGWEGAIAVADKSFAGKFVSPEYRTFRCIDGIASPAYLARLVVTPWFWKKLAQVERGLGGRRQRTKPEQFLGLELLMPTYEQQLTALPLFQRLDALRPLQSATQTELDALLPAMLDKAFRGEL